MEENQHTAAEEGGSGSGRRMEDEESNRPNHAHRFTTRLPTKAAPWARTPPSCVPRAPPFAENGSWPASRSPPIAGTRSPETTDTSTEEENELRNADENEMNIAQRVRSFLARKAAARRARDARRVARDARRVAQFSPERNRGATEEVRTAAAGPGTPSPRHFGSLHLGTTDDLPLMTAAAARPFLAELLDEIECWQRLLLELHTEIVTAEDLHAMYGTPRVGRAFHLRDEALRMRVLELGRCIAWRAREQTPASRETGAATH